MQHFPIAPYRLSARGVFRAISFPRNSRFAYYQLDVSDGDVEPGRSYYGLRIFGVISGLHGVRSAVAAASGLVGRDAAASGYAMGIFSIPVSAAVTSPVKSSTTLD